MLSVLRLTSATTDQPDRGFVILNSGSRICSLPQRGQREGAFTLFLSRNTNPQALHSGWRMMNRFFPFELLRICSRSSRRVFTGAPIRRARSRTVTGPLRRTSTTDWRLVRGMFVSYFLASSEASSERSGRRHGWGWSGQRSGPRQIFHSSIVPGMSRVVIGSIVKASSGSKIFLT